MTPELEAALTELRRSVVATYASGAVLVHDLLIDEVLTEIDAMPPSIAEECPALVELRDRIRAAGRQ